MAGFVLTAQLKLAAPGNVKAIVTQINNALRGVSVNVNINVNNATKQLNQVSRAAKQATNDMERFGEQSAAAIRRYGAFTVATGAFLKLTQAISGGIDEAIKFDREIVRLQQVTGQSAAGVKGISDEVTRLSKAFGVSSSEILHVSVTLAQAGLTAKDTKTALEALAKTSVSATFGDIRNTTEAAIAIMQQFGKSAKDLEGILGSINAVSARYAVESEDITVAVRRAGAAFQSAGGDLKEFEALFTSVRQTTRESAETIATGFRTIFTRLQRTRTQNFLETIGIDVKDVEGQFIGPYKAIQKLSQALKDIKGTDPRFAQIVEELGGFRQISKVIPLITKFEVAQEALNVAIRGGNSLTSDAEKSQEALSIQISKVKEEFLSLIRTLTNSAAFRGVIDLTLKFTSSLIRLVEVLEPVLPLIGAFGAAKLSQGAGAFFTGFKGRIGKFAGGGIVPGSGNGDTVPAMLTPGEFVIKKQAVQAIGAHSLNKMNKYATAGEVTGGVSDATLSKYTSKPQVANRIGFFTASKLAQMKNGTAAERKQYEGLVNDYRLTRGTSAAPQVTPKDKVDIGRRISGSVLRLNDLPSMVTADPSYIDKGGSSVSIETTPKEIIAASKSKENLALTKALEKYDGVSGSVKVFGLTSRAGDAFSRTMEPGLLRLIDATIKKSVPPEARKSILDPQSPPPLDGLISKSAIQSIKGTLFEVLLRRASKTMIDNPNDDDVLDIRGNADFSALIAGGKNVAPADAKVAANADAFKSIVSKHLRDKLNKGAKFASGGMAKGSDTVPAMLTPGEFVINKESAKSIGYGNLHRMNKVQKFARGGVVNGAINTASSPLASLAIFGFLQSFVSNLDSTNKELNQFTKSMSEAGLQFSVFSNLISSTRSSLPGRLQQVTTLGLGADDVLSEDVLRKKIRREEFANFRTQNSVPVGTKLTPAERRKVGGIADARLDASLSRRDRVNFLNSAPFALAGAVGSVAGGFIQDAGRQKIAAGNAAGVGQSAAGGALSGAAIGLSVGAILGPFGAAVGATVGGIIGYTSTLKQAERDLRSVQFDKALTEFERRINNFATGKVSASSTSFGVSSDIIELNKKINNASSADERNDLTAKFNQNSSGIEKFFGAVAQNSSTLEEFNQKTKNTLLTFAFLSNIPFNELEAQIKDQIEAGEKLRKQTGQLIQARDEEARRIIVLNAFYDSIASANDSIGQFSSVLENFTSKLGGGSASFKFANNSNLFESASKGQLSDTSKFEKVVGTLSAPFQGLANDLGKEAVQNAAILNKLPQILLDTRNSGLLNAEGGDNFEKKFESAIRASFANIPEETLNSLIAGVRGVVGPGGDDTKIISSINENVFGAAEQIGKALRVPIDVLKEFEPKFREHGDNLIKGIELETQARVKATEISVDILQKSQDLQNFITRAQGNPVTSQTVLGQRNARIAALGGSSDINDIIARRNSASSTIDRLTADQKTGDISNADITTLANAKTQYQQTTEALKQLADTSEALSAIQSDLADAEERRKFKIGFADTIAFGTKDEKKQLAGNVSKVAFAQRFGLNALSNVNPDAPSQIFQFLKSVPKGQKIFGQDAEDIINNLRNQKLGGVKGVNNAALIKGANEQAKEGQTPEAKFLIGKLEEVFAVQKQALGVFKTDAESIGTKVASALQTTNDKFISDLRGIFIDNVNRDTLNDINTLGGQRAKAQTALAAGNSLSGTFGLNGLGAEDLKNVIGANSLLSERHSLLGERDSINSKFNSGFTVNGADSLDTTLQKAFQKTGVKLNTEDFGKIVGANLPQLGGAKVDVQRVIDKKFAEIGAEKLKDVNTRIETNTSNIKDNGAGANVIGSFDSANAGVRKSFLDENTQMLKDLGGKSLPELTAEIANLTRAIESKKGSIIARAAGGTVPGQGSGDTVPAMLTPGEFVIRKAAVDAIGLDTLHSMNNMQYFASGGSVERRKKANEAQANRLREFAGNRIQRLLDAGKSSSFAEDDKLVQRLQSKAKGLENKAVFSAVSRAGFSTPGTLKPEELAKKKAASDAKRAEIVFQAKTSRGLTAELQTKILTDKALAKENPKQALEKRKQEALSNRAGIQTLRFERLSGSAGHQEFLRNEALSKNPTTAFSPQGSSFIGPKSRADIARENIANRNALFDRFDENNRLAIQKRQPRRQKFAAGGSVGGGGGTTRLEGIEQFNRVVQTFSTSANKLADSLDKFPHEIALKAEHTVQVIFNGAEILTKLEPEIQRMAIEQSRTAINNMIESKFPDVGKV